MSAATMPLSQFAEYRFNIPALIHIEEGPSECYHSAIILGQLRYHAEYGCGIPLRTPKDP